MSSLLTLDLGPIGGLGGSPALLSAGAYHANGSVSLAPLVGNYTQTTNFDDGSPGDTTTRETSNGASQTEVIVLAAKISIASWAQTKKYKGVHTQSFSYWDGSTWQPMTDTNVAVWGVHSLSYADESRTATFSGPEVTIVRCVSTESDTSGGNMSTSDSRPSA